MDQNVPAAISEGLRRREMDVLTAFEDRTAEWEDSEILNRANELDRILFTQDRDFLILAADLLKDGRSFSGIVFCPQQRYPHGILVDWLDLVASLLERSDLQNKVVFVPMK
jgi:hypothetical protein